MKRTSWLIIFLLAILTMMAQQKQGNFKILCYNVKNWLHDMDTIIRLFRKKMAIRLQ